MATQTRTLNLTPLFLAWSALFVLLAVVQDNYSLLWWAAAPWFFVFGFIAVIAAMLGVMYLRGAPVTVTTSKGVRVVRRGQPAVWKVRNTARGRR